MFNKRLNFCSNHFNLLLFLLKRYLLFILKFYHFFIIHYFLLKKYLKKKPKFKFNANHKKNLNIKSLFFKLTL